MKRVLMVCLLVLMCLGVVSSAPAGERSFSWDLNTDGAVGYNLYWATTSMGYFQPAPNDTKFDPTKLILTAWDPGLAGHPSDVKNIEYIITGLRGEFSRDIGPDGAYFFVISAIDEGGNESGASNEVTTTIDDTPPVPPTGLQCNVP